MRRSISGAGFYFICLVIMMGAMFWFNTTALRTDYVSYQEYEKELQRSDIAKVHVYQNRQVPTGHAVLTMKDGSEKELNVSDVIALQEQLKASNVEVILHDVEKENTLVTSVLPMILMGVFMMVFVLMMNRQAGGGSKMMNFGKSRATMILPNEKSKTFKDVAGLQEEKEDLEELVDFLKNPQKYVHMGARIPKGVILVGPPGTGKTLLAKAVAGEAGVPFFTISGSDFMEMFVGVGASRVRDLFEEAKKHSPCIVFIDEIDAVARQRGTGMGGGHDEREQTLNQLLVEMDGFAPNEGIIVMAATNRVDILDPAILRPGRFDRKIGVGAPDVKGREEILKVHAKDKPLGEDVDLATVAKTTAGFTGADLENLMNESAIGAAKAGKGYIRQEDIEQAFVKVGIGTEKKSKVLSEEDKRITAYHEAGHAIMFHVLPNVGPVHSISIIPNGMGALGYTMPLPEDGKTHYTKGKMLDTLAVNLGGRVAEELVIHDITAGASQDIKEATKLAYSMVTKWGMSEKVGLINYVNESDEVFIGRDMAHTRSYSESVATMIDSEVKCLIDEAHERAIQCISENMDVLHACAALLLEKEKITREEFEELFVKNI